VILLALFASGCYEQNDCLVNNSNILKITLKGKTLGKDTSVTFTSIRKLNTAGDLYTNKLLGSLEVPLEIQDSITTVIFNYNEKLVAVSDTMVVAYRNQSRVINPYCGAYLYQVDVNVPKTDFEKVKVTTPVLLTTVTKNLEIFL